MYEHGLIDLIPLDEYIERSWYFWNIWIPRLSFNGLLAKDLEAIFTSATGIPVGGK